jgi:hypothetical protein
MINHSEQLANLAAALLKAQKAIGHAMKSADNPYYKSRYADLTVVIDSVKEPLNENGISFLQAVDENGEGKPVVDTILLHDSGQYLSTRTPVFCKKPDDPQAFGSGVTYSKRYALQAILGLPTEDDDAEGAMARNQKKKGSANWDSPKDEAPKEQQIDVTAIIEQVHFEYITEHSDMLPEGYEWDKKLFETELKAVFKKLIPVKRKKFDWTDKAAITELAKKIKPDKTIKESKAA